MSAVDHIKGSAKRLARHYGYDIRRIADFSHKNIVDFFASRRVSLVLDVGANNGQFGRTIRHLGFDGQIISFEPIRSVFAELAARTRLDPDWEVRNYALGAQDGWAEINISRNTVFSSLLEQTEAAQLFDRNSEVFRKESIEIRKLDSIAPTLPDGVVFIKIDTQGFEQSILAGAQDYLRRVSGVQLELPIVHLYTNTWRFCEAVEYMDDLGFVISNLWPVNFDSRDPVSLLEVDCLFKRREQP